MTDERTAADQEVAPIDWPDSNRRAREQMQQEKDRQTSLALTRAPEPTVQDGAVVLTLTHHQKPTPPKTEAEKRDEKLAALERWRTDAIAYGKMHADKLVRDRGRVTSVEVLASMREAGHGALIDSIDGRWIGAVFRGGRGWRRIGWESTGSHSRPVAIWERASAEGGG